MPSKLLLIMLDGCRPDALQQVNAPRLRSLWENGAYTFSAQTVTPSVTLPCHNALFRGVPPSKHGVKADNLHRKSAEAFTSITEQAKLHNKKTALFYSWEQLRDLQKPGNLDFAYLRNATYGLDNDTPVAQACADFLVQEQADFCFLYLGDIDIMGHLFGWMSLEYCQAIEANDAAVGIVLDALASAGLRDQYTLLVQADHGGHDTGHGTELPEDMTIPWLLNGPEVKRGHALSTPVQMLDSTVTMAHILGIPAAPEWEGKVVLEAFV